MQKIFKQIGLTLLILFGVLIIVPNKFAVECSDDISGKSNDEIKAIISACESKINETRLQLNTIGSNISEKNQKIASLKNKIEKIRSQTQDIESEIENREVQIQTLDNNITSIMNDMLLSVSEEYKRISTAPTLVDIIFSSHDFSGLINNLSYSAYLRQERVDDSFQVERVKVAHEDIKENAQNDLEELQDVSEYSQKAITIESNAAQIAKEQYNKTKSEEEQYQRLLQEAQSQLEGFKSFVSSAGGGAIGANGFGSGSNGWYMSQRDSRWASVNIGGSKESILEVGCLLTSVAMSLRSYGVDSSPSQIASNRDYFFANTAYFLSRERFSWPNGLKYKSFAKSEIRTQLQAGKPVIVGIKAGKYGTHFVVLFKLDGDNFVMHDPYYGPDKKFQDYYSEGRIFSAGMFYQ